ncbi:MAG: tetratricopeptide repeat protein [Thermodesulfobacteriota bacterium]
MGRLERLLNKADNFKEAGRFDEALNELSKAMRIAPHDPDVYLSIALTYDCMGDFDHSIKYFKNALHLSPEDSYLWTQFGVTLSRMGRNNVALEIFQHALTLDPDYTFARWNRALTHRALGCYEDSISDFIKCIQSQNDSEFIKNEIHYQLGLCYFDMGWTKEALRELQTQIELYPYDTWAQLAIGNCYLDFGWIDESINKFKEIIGFFPDFIPAYNSLALSLAEKGWFDEALDVLRSGLKIAPHDESLIDNFNYIESLMNDEDGNRGMILLSIMLQIIKRRQFFKNHN